MEITVKTINGTDFKMQTTAQTSIMQLRQEIGRKLAVQSDRVRLIFNGRVLNNADTVDKYNIVDCSIVHCVIRPEQTPSAAPSAASAGSVSAAASRSTGASVPSSNATPTASASAGTSRPTGSAQRTTASSSTSAPSSSSSSSRQSSAGRGGSGSQGPGGGASSSRGASTLPHGAAVAVMGVGPGGPNGGFFTMGSGPPGFESMISDLFAGIPVQQSMQIPLMSSASPSTQSSGPTPQERLLAQAVNNVVGNALFGLQASSGTTTATTGTTTATTSTSTTTANTNSNTVPTAAATTAASSAGTTTPAGGAGRAPPSTTGAAAPVTPVQQPSQPNGTPSNNMPWQYPGGNYYTGGVPYSPYGSPLGSNMYPGSASVLQFNQVPGMPFAYQQSPMMMAPQSSPYGMNMTQQVNFFPNPTANYLP